MADQPIPLHPDQGPAPEQAPLQPGHPELVEHALLIAVQRAAEGAAMGGKNSQEVSDFGRGALAFAQALVQLRTPVPDPSQQKPPSSGGQGT